MTKQRRQIFPAEPLTVLCMCTLAAALMWPMLQRAHTRQHEATCLGNLRTLAAGVTMYAQEHNGMLPAAWDDANSNGVADSGESTWAEGITPYVKERTAFTCPAANGTPTSYGYGWWASGRTLATFATPRVVPVLADADAPVLHAMRAATTRHDGAAGIAFLDGHVQLSKPADLHFFADDFSSDTFPIMAAEQAAWQGDGVGLVVQSAKAGRWMAKTPAGVSIGDGKLRLTAGTAIEWFAQDAPAASWETAKAMPANGFHFEGDCTLAASGTGALSAQVHTARSRYYTANRIWLNDFFDDFPNPGFTVFATDGGGKQVTATDWWGQAFPHSEQIIGGTYHVQIDGTAEGWQISYSRGRLFTSGVITVPYAKLGTDKWVDIALGSWEMGAKPQVWDNIVLWW